MPDSLKPKAKLDTRLDRIYYSYLQGEDDEDFLTEKDKEVRDQLEAAWALLVNYHSFEQAVPLLKSRYNISRATCYRLLNQCTQLFGDVSQVDKQGMRNILYEYSMKVFQLAATQKPPELTQMNRAIKNMAMLKGLDQNEANAFDAELLEAHTYMMQLKSGSGTTKTIDISNLQKLPEAEYAVVVDSVENVGLGEQSIEDILDGKVFNQKEDDES